MVIAAWLQVFTAIFAASITAAVLFTAGATPVLALVIAYLFLAVLLTVGFRLLRVGLAVSHRGLRIRRLTVTRTLAWSQIDEVHSRAARRFGQDTHRQAIWIVPRGRAALETPIQLYGDDARGPRARYGRVLGAVEYGEILRLLRRRAAAAGTGEPPAAPPRAGRSWEIVAEPDPWDAN
jgi:Bacterial PH domain